MRRKYGSIPRVAFPVNSTMALCGVCFVMDALVERRDHGELVAHAVGLLVVLGGLCPRGLQAVDEVDRGRPDLSEDVVPPFLKYFVLKNFFELPKSL